MKNSVIDNKIQAYYRFVTSIFILEGKQKMYILQHLYNVFLIIPVLTQHYKCTLTFVNL